MAPRRHKHTSNSTFGIVRPPNAFSCYLASLKGSAAKCQQVRLRCKTTVWRMELLKQTFWSMGFALQSPFREAALQALSDARAKRAAALRASASIVRPAAVAAPTNSAEADAGDAAAVAAGIAQPAAVAAGTFPCGCKWSCLKVRRCRSKLPRP
jgi:hypothetical protein